MALNNVIETVWLETDRLIQRVDRLGTNLAASFRRLELEGQHAYSATQEARASAVLYGMAELESLTRFTVTVANRYINGLALPISAVRPCLRGIAAHEWFESLRALQDASKMWERRTLATTMESNTDALRLPIVGRPKAQPPLDGKTLRPEHFALIWAVYGLDLEPFPKGHWQTTLRKLSGVRNDLAHGNIPFDEVFKQPGLTESEVQSYLEDLSHFALHFSSTWDAYLTGSAYLSP